MEHLITKAAAKLGGLAKLAAALGESVQTVSNWRERGVPIHKCAQLEQVTEAQVTRRELRPNDWHRIWPELVTDDFPAPQPNAAAA